MQLTGLEIVDRNIIGNYCKEGIQQQGVDVRLDKVVKVGGRGYIPTVGKTQLPKDNLVVMTMPTNKEGQEIPTYFLGPGYYEIEFLESCEMSSNIVLNFKTRSSLVRCGAVVLSGQFDGGFKTNKMGAFLYVMNPDGIWIEKGARVAQAIVTETHEVESDYLYNGQWQNDKQRNK